MDRFVVWWRSRSLSELLNIAGLVLNVAGLVLGLRGQ